MDTHRCLHCFFGILYLLTSFSAGYPADNYPILQENGEVPILRTPSEVLIRGMLDFEGQPVAVPANAVDHIIDLAQLLSLTWP